MLNYGALEVERRVQQVSGDVQLGQQGDFQGLSEREDSHSSGYRYQTVTRATPRIVKEVQTVVVTDYRIVGYTTARHELTGASGIEVPAGATVSYEMVETPTGVTTYAVVSTPRFGQVQRSEQRVVERIEYDYVQGVEVIPTHTSNRTSLAVEWDVQGSSADDQIEVGNPVNWQGFGRIEGGEGNDNLLARSHLRPTHYLDQNYYGHGAGTQLRTGLYLDGGAGNDTIGASDANDVLVGGAGHDVLGGGGGNDSYVMAAGHDWVGDFGSDNTAGIDQVILPEHVTPEMLAITLVDRLPPGAQASPDSSPLKALRLQWSADDSVTIALPRTDAYAIASRAYSPPAPATPGVEAVLIAGQAVALGELLAAASSASQSVGDSLGNDNLFGSPGQDDLIGGAGADELWGGAGADRLVGDRAVLGSSAGFLGSGERGHTYDGPGDTFSGGQGDDLVWLTHGNGTIRFELGDGVDTYTSWGRDVVQFAYGSDDYWTKQYARSDLLGSVRDASVDTVKFGPGIGEQDLRLEKIPGIGGPDHLIVHVGEQGDRLVFIHAGATS